MDGWGCAACGGQNPDGMRFCGHCGTPRPAVEAAPPQEPPRQTEELRLITALFADISGFTDLAQRVDAEELQEIIDPIVARLSDLVAGHDGWIEKYAGDAVLALFGAPTAHDDDAERALATALEMHLELARIIEELPEAAAGLTLHVGVNSGHGIARMVGGEGRLDYAVLGDAVITAQRLESATPSGETYVGAMTVGLARGRFELVSVGALELKGKGEPVPAWRLVGPAGVGARRARTVVPHLVGRARESMSIAAAVASTQAGGGGLLALVGEAGQGKSVLVEAARDDRPPSLAWQETRCLAYGAALGYRPISELLRAWAGVHPEDRPEVAGPTIAEALARLGLGYRIGPIRRLAGLAVSGSAAALAAGDVDPLDELDPEALRRTLHDAFLDWLERLTVDGPRVLFVEDVHWADPSTVALLTETAAFIGEEGLPVLILVTARDDNGPAWTAIRAIEGATVISLGPLDRSDVGALAADLAGGPVPGLPRRRARGEDRRQPTVHRVDGAGVDRRRFGQPRRHRDGAAGTDVGRRRDRTDHRGRHRLSARPATPRRRRGCFRRHRSSGGGSDSGCSKA